MARDPLVLRGEMTLADCAPIVAASRHRLFPVVADERLLGVVTREAVLTGAADIVVGSIAEEPRLVATEDELLVDVVARMKERDVDRCPVVDGDGRVVGFLSPSDILRARMLFA